MKRILSLVLVLVSVLTYADSVQQGCVKTRGRMINGKHVPGQGLPGSIVSIKDRTAIGVKNSNGTFSFPVTDNQFRVDSVKKKDYVLLDADAASKTYTHTADTLFFIMETPERILQDKLATERRLRRSLQAKLQAREEELDSLIAIQKISQEEYQHSLQKLYAEQSENDKLITDMAERYSTLDYDQMDEFYRQVSYYIEQCEFVKADSLLKTLGNIHVQLEAAKQQGQAIQQDEEKLQRAKVVHQHDIDELAKRCYSYFENFKMQYQNDSAAYYLEQRVKLDTTNAQWLDEYADFLDVYLTQYDKALEYHQQSLAIRKQIFGESHPSVANSYNNIGTVYHSHDDYARALEYYQKSLVIWKQVFGDFHPDVAFSYNNIGCVYHSQGDYAHALEYHQHSLTIRKQLLGESHPDVAASYNNIGIVYHSHGDYARSLEYFQQSLTIWKQVYGESHPSVATSYDNIGSVYYSQGDYARALESYQKALDIRKQVLGLEHPDTKDTQEKIEQTLQKLNEEK